MKKQIKSQANDWSQWTPELKEALKVSTNNTQVGEKLMYENSEFCVWSIHLPAGQSLPFHKHANRYFWTAMNVGKSRSYYNNGSMVDTEYEIGDTKYFGNLNEENFFMHNPENIGDSMLIYTTVEFLN